MNDNNSNPNHQNPNDPPPDFAKQIEKTVRSAVESGDLSRLKDLGPTITNVAKDFSQKVGAEIQKSAQQAQTGQQAQHQAQSPPQQNGAGRYRQAPPRPVQRQMQQQGQQRPAWMGSGPSTLMPRSSPVRSYGTGSIVAGVLGTVSFGFSALITGLAALLGSGGVSIGGFALGFLVPFGLSVGLLVSGVTKRKLTLRLKRYYEFFNVKNVVTLVELSEGTGRGVTGVRSDIRKAIAKKLYKDVRMDVNETCVIRGEEAYQLYVETEKNRLAREQEEAERKNRLEDPKTAEMEAFKLEGRRYLGKIKEANAAIPGQEISEKLTKLEDTAAQIVKYVELHPEKLPDTRKFMDYYLPTTLKMVEKYKYYEEQDVQVKSVQHARAEIEKALDNINVAFKNLLNSLYQEDTLDVSTDIKVLETMLEQEGLTGKQFKIDPVSFDPIN